MPFFPKRAATVPQMLEKAVLINAPFVFNALWGIVRPWLQQQTLDKVRPAPMHAHGDRSKPFS